MFENWEADQLRAQSLRDASQEAIESNYRSEDVSRRLEKLSLLCQAMWELLRERAEVTDAMLAEKVLEVDLRDGRQDSRIGESVFNCPHCKSPVNSRSPRCVMCGKVVPTPHPFEV